MSAGRSTHMQLSAKFADDRKIITFKQFFQDRFKFCNRSLLFPLTVPLHYCILYMQQTDEYMLAPDCVVSTYKKLDYERRGREILVISTYYYTTFIIIIIIIIILNILILLLQGYIIIKYYY